MVSRIGSFPLSVAVDSILNIAGDSEIILDPFCGKGTTLTAARLLGKRALGIDASPEAHAISLGKIQNVGLDQLAGYIKSLRLKKHPIADIDPRVKVYYHPETLSQLMSIRSVLSRHIESNEAKLKGLALTARGLLLGILHGHNVNALSVKSSHTISFSPDYVRRFCLERNIVAPARDVKECLLRQATKVFADELPPGRFNRVILGSAEKSDRLYANYKGRIDLILTSPPYLHKQTYAKDNWLRLWFLGYDYRDVQRWLIETADINLYRKRIGNALLSSYNLLRTKGKLVVITGTVRKTKKIKGESHDEFIDLGQIIVEIADRVPGLKPLMVSRQIVDHSRRRLGVLRKSAGHSAYDREEQIVTIEKYA